MTTIQTGSTNTTQQTNRQTNSSYGTQSNQSEELIFNLAVEIPEDAQMLTEEDLQKEDDNLKFGFTDEEIAENPDLAEAINCLMQNAIKEANVDQNDIEELFSNLKEENNSDDFQTKLKDIAKEIANLFNSNKDSKKSEYDNLGDGKYNKSIFSDVIDSIKKIFGIDDKDGEVGDELGAATASDPNNKGSDCKPSPTGKSPDNVTACLQ